jgi:hypothetical protein
MPFFERKVNLCRAHALLASSLPAETKVRCHKRAFIGNCAGRDRGRTLSFPTPTDAHVCQLGTCGKGKAASRRHTLAVLLSVALAQRFEPENRAL